MSSPTPTKFSDIPGSLSLHGKLNWLQANDKCFTGEDLLHAFMDYCLGRNITSAEFIQSIIQLVNDDSMVFVFNDIHRTVNEDGIIYEDTEKTTGTFVEVAEGVLRFESVTETELGGVL